MALNIDGLRIAIDEVVIDGKILTAKEQNELLQDAYYTTVTYYIIKRRNNDAAYITSLKAQIRGLCFDSVSISNLDRNTLLLSIYDKAFSYYDSGVAFNRYFRTGAGVEPIIDPTPGTTSFLTVNYSGYNLNEG